MNLFGNKKVSVKCLVCGNISDVDQGEVDKALTDPQTKIMELVCKACKGTKASLIHKVAWFEKVKKNISGFWTIFWDKITDILATIWVYAALLWSYWQLDVEVICRQLIVYFIIFGVAYLVILLTPLKSYLFALLLIILITWIKGR